MITITVHIYTTRCNDQSEELCPYTHRFKQNIKQQIYNFTTYRTSHRDGTLLSVMVVCGMAFALAKVKDFILVHTCLSNDLPRG